MTEIRAKAMMTQTTVPTPYMPTPSRHVRGETDIPRSMRSCAFNFAIRAAFYPLSGGAIRNSVDGVR